MTSVYYLSTYERNKPKCYCFIENQFFSFLFLVTSWFILNPANEFILIKTLTIVNWNFSINVNFKPNLLSFYIRKNCSWICDLSNLVSKIKMFNSSLCWMGFTFIIYGIIQKFHYEKDNLCCTTLRIETIKEKSEK